MRSNRQGKFFLILLCCFLTHITATYGYCHPCFFQGEVSCCDMFIFQNFFLLKCQHVYCCTCQMIIGNRSWTCQIFTFINFYLFGFWRTSVATIQQVQVFLHKNYLKRISPYFSLRGALTLRGPILITFLTLWCKALFNLTCHKISKSFIILNALLQAM